MLLAGLFLACTACTSPVSKESQSNKVLAEEPKIVNIVNFIRLLEPRDPKITEEIMYKTVVKQIEIMNLHKLPGTFLLQYDALIDPRYQKLLSALPKDTFEIGAWWELPQPLVEKAGLKWRGRFPWDWHANVGFSTGYTPTEREKLIDVYMADFKKVFGYYPKSVGSWFIDAHSLNYMYEKYKIVASSNCKDQFGTDGYTLWGGYWNQAYYPSKINAYMPAQNAENQIPVPIFRMLGSDPIRQYDTGLGTQRQGVITLEPVYEFGGGDLAWVDWFFKRFTEDPALGFNYTQAGQENSFTWDAMSKGYEIQIPLIAKLRAEGKLKVETMEQSGLWFKENYKVTPATSFVVNEDLAGSDMKTIWYNSRFYRMNVLWEKGNLRIRDIHLFDESFADGYTTQAATSNECKFFTLPVVEGYLWSKPEETLAGLRLKALVDGREILLGGSSPVFKNSGKSTVVVSWPLTTIEGTFEMEFNEHEWRMELKTSEKLDWYLDLSTAKGIDLPIRKIEGKAVSYHFEGMDYAFKAHSGIFTIPEKGTVWRLKPEQDKIVLDLKAMK